MSCRYVLRPVIAADTAALQRCFDDPGVRRFLFDDRRVTLDATRALVAGSLTSFAERALKLWVLFDHADLVGFGALQPDPDPHASVAADRASADLMYGLLPSH
jgi:hypothetical protein